MLIGFILMIILVIKVLIICMRMEKENLKR